jgi:Uma2 family endonuclease
MMPGAAPLVPDCYNRFRLPMTTIAAPSSSLSHVAAGVGGTVRRFSVGEYHRLIATGVLIEGEPLELLEGWIVYKMTRSPPHDVALGLAGDAIDGRLPTGWHVREQSAITTADSEPEPDLAVTRGARRDYNQRHPGPGDLALVVEVADSTLSLDRDDKARIYARAGIAVYWIINLVDRRVEAYTKPTGTDPAPAYRRRDDYGPADAIPLTLPGSPPLSNPVAELLP